MTPYMEKESIRNKKRSRDNGGEDPKGSHKGKKQESVVIKRDPFENSEKTLYEFSEGIDVFDFPWLKEGVVFIADDEYFEPEELFGPCSYLDDAYGSFEANFHQDECEFHDKKLDDDDGRFGSLEIDLFESIDCIWNCVDQPLDISLKKG